MRHSASRLPGGKFTVRVVSGPTRVRVEVIDARGPWSTQPDSTSDRDQRDDSDRGRGLAIIDALAAAWGMTSGAGTRTVWFDLTCD